MKRIATTLALCSTLAATGCKKDDPPTTPPTDTGAGAEVDSGDVAPEPVAPDVPQEPDPAEIAEGAHQYITGHYQEAIDLLSPVYADLKERSQYRASGLAGGWLALAHAKIVFENGEEPSTHAVAMGVRTQDPEVIAVSKLSEGAILTGQEDYAAAKAALAAAAKASPKTAAGALANILRAEALIGSAFGSGASDTIESPQDLEDAKAAYAAAMATAKSGIETDILAGLVEEGLAAIARYQRDNAGICTHALASLDHLTKAEASDYMIDGPRRMASDYKCKPDTE